MDRRHDLFYLRYWDTAREGGIFPCKFRKREDVGRPALRPPRPFAVVEKFPRCRCRGAASSTPRGPGMPGPYDVFSPQRHVDLILDGKAVDRQLCHRYGQPLGKCAAVEP